MKKLLLLAAGLVLTTPGRSQAIFGNGIETIKTEVLYWAVPILGIGFLGLAVWCGFNKFSGQNRDIWGGVGLLLTYVAFVGALWAGYDYVTSMR